MKKQNVVITIVALLVIGLGVGYFVGYDQEGEKSDDRTSDSKVSSFEDCVEAGNPVMESYPRQCRHEDELFVEQIGNELEKTDLIRLSSPRPNASIASPLVLTGEARGYWFFEANFPIVLTSTDGEMIAQHYAQAQDEWMSEDFVPFEAVLEFKKPESGERGTLMLLKSNASGLPEHDDALEIPVYFE